jgi:predicted secreted hydrolase
VTFFRTRVDATQSMQSAFAAKQLIFAHAALTDVQGRKLWHDQRIAREGFGVAGADGRDAAITLRDWSLTRRPADGAWLARLPGNDFSFDLVFEPTQPVLLQGDQGLSRKGPDPGQASYYYSLPQMAARGRITLKGRALEVSGQAWLDHEWSEALLHPDAVGWDWIGMNLLDGSALTAFRLRSKTGRAAMGWRLIPSPRGQPLYLQPGRGGVQPAARLEKPDQPGQLPGGVDRAHARRISTRSGPSSTTRSSTAGPPPAPSTGRA